MRVWPALFLCLLPMPTLAADESTYLIRQLLLEKNRIVVSFSGNLAEGADLIATFANGKQCLLRIVKVKEKLANADTSLCANSSDLVVGQKLEISLSVEDLTEPPQPATPVEPQVIRPMEAPTEKNLPEIRSSNREITDLQYLPAKGVVSADLAFKKSKGVSDLSIKGSGQSLVFGEVRTDSIAAELSYGITNQFVIRLGLGWTLKSETTSSFGPASIIPGEVHSSKSSGMEDPIYAINYRLSEQSNGIGKVDFLLGYSPSYKKHKSETELKDGDVYRGGDLAMAGIRLGQQLGRFSHYFQIQANLYGESSSYDAVTNEQTKESSHSVTLISLAGQIQASDRTFLRGEITEALYSSTKFKSPGADDSSVESFNQTNLTAEILAVLIPKHFAVAFAAGRDLNVNVGARSGTLGLQANTYETALAFRAIAEF
jgi:hypothetical protein